MSEERDFDRELEHAHAIGDAGLAYRIRQERLRAGFASERQKLTGQTFDHNGHVVQEATGPDLDDLDVKIADAHDVLTSQPDLSDFDRLIAQARDAKDARTVADLQNQRQAVVERHTAAQREAAQQSIALQRQRAARIREHEDAQAGAALKVLREGIGQGASLASTRSGGMSVVEIERMNRGA